MEIEDGTQFGSLGVLGKIKVDFQMQEPEKGYTQDIPYSILKGRYRED